VLQKHTEVESNKEKRKKGRDKQIKNEGWEEVRKKNKFFPDIFETLYSSSNIIRTGNVARTYSSYTRKQETVRKEGSKEARKRQ
jgi:hypothetical protein